MTISKKFDQAFCTLNWNLACVGMPLTNSCDEALKFPVTSVISGTSPKSE